MSSQSQSANSCGCLIAILLCLFFGGTLGGWGIAAIIIFYLMVAGGANASGFVNRPHIESLGRSFLQCLAKIAKSDGRVSEAEARLIGDLIRQNYPEVLHEEVRKIFNAARDDNRTFEDYCRTFAGYANALPQEGRLPFLAIFCQLAAQDGASEAKMRMLHFAEQILGCTGFVAQCFGQTGRADFRKPASGDELDEAYRVLGCRKGASPAEVKKAYRKKCAEFHPDRLQAKGMPKKYIEYAEEEMKKINLAYDTICRIFPAGKK